MIETLHLMRYLDTVLSISNNKGITYHARKGNCLICHWVSLLLAIEQLLHFTFQTKNLITKITFGGKIHRLKDKLKHPRIEIYISSLASI